MSPPASPVIWDADEPIVMRSDRPGMLDEQHIRLLKVCHRENEEFPKGGYYAMFEWKGDGWRYVQLVHFVGVFITPGSWDHD